MKLFIKAIAMVGLTATAMSSNATGLFDSFTGNVGISNLQTTDMNLITNWGGCYFWWCRRNETDFRSKCYSWCRCKS